MNTDKEKATDEWNWNGQRKLNIAGLLAGENERNVYKLSLIL